MGCSIVCTCVKYLQTSVSLVHLVTMQRKVVKPEGFTFSNGITLPQGSILGVPERAVNTDSGAISYPLFLL